VKQRLTIWALRLAIGVVIGQGFAHAQGECRTAVITAFSVQQYPGQMRNELYSGPNVGTAVAVGVDRSGAPLVPLGTVVWIEGVGERTVMDTGHGGAGWFDVLMQTTREAVQFGRQTRLVCP
jgi:3D (Asp-Asp-Asp) domain-containing protein